MRGPRDPYRFVPEELDPFIQEKIVGMGTFPFKGEEYEYGLLDPRIEPVHYTVCMPEGQNLLASSEIPQELLPYYLGHEIQCSRLYAGESGRCARLEAELLDSLDPAIRHAVLCARQRTFEDLVSLYRINPNRPVDDFQKEIALTTMMLRRRLLAL